MALPAVLRFLCPRRFPLETMARSVAVAVAEQVEEQFSAKVIVVLLVQAVAVAGAAAQVQLQIVQVVLRAVDLFLPSGLLRAMAAQELLLVLGLVALALSRARSLEPRAQAAAVVTSVLQDRQQQTIKPIQALRLAPAVVALQYPGTATSRIWRQEHV